MCQRVFCWRSVEMWELLQKKINLILKRNIECDVDTIEKDWNKIKFKTCNDFEEFMGYAAEHVFILSTFFKRVGIF